MGLEPTTSCLQSRRSAGLSYVPKRANATPLWANSFYAITEDANFVQGVWIEHCGPGAFASFSSRVINKASSDSANATYQAS